jgi:hypothetical protein
MKEVLHEHHSLEGVKGGRLKGVFSTPYLHQSTRCANIVLCPRREIMDVSRYGAMMQGSYVVASTATWWP